MESKELSVELRDRTVRHRSGEGYKTISGVLKLPKSTVCSIIRKENKYGTTKTLPQAGHLTKLSNFARRTLIRELTKNPMTTLTELRSSFTEMEEPAKRPTISAALHESRLYGWVAKWKPLLRKRHMTACLEFAKRHVKHWEHEAKDSVVWWDENWTLWPECKAQRLAETEHSSSPIEHHPYREAWWLQHHALKMLFSGRDWETWRIEGTMNRAKYRQILERICFRV